MKDAGPVHGLHRAFAGARPGLDLRVGQSFAIAAASAAVPGRGPNCMESDAVPPAVNAGFAITRAF